MDLTQLSIDALCGQDFACTCGRTHKVATRRILIEKGAVAKSAQVLDELGLEGEALVVCDEHTYAVAGEQVVSILRDAGRKVRVLKLRHQPLHADGAALGDVLLAMGDDTKVLVAVGSGTINDTTRMAAFRLNLPYIIVGTAPSMDGYASSVSPMIYDGYKITYEAVAPMAIIGDTDVLCAAPEQMIAAGFGDMLGKLTARLDWVLAREVIGEHYCPTVAAMMARAVDKCLAQAEGLSRREPEAIVGLMEGLILSGIAMQMLGYSRPASGAEHHIAHYFEMKAMREGSAGSLHGDKVGVAALLIMDIYAHLFSEGIPAQGPGMDQAKWESEICRVYGDAAEAILAENAQMHPDKAEWEAQKARALALWPEYQKQTADFPALIEKGRSWLRAIGGPALPQDMGYTRAEMRDALLYSKEVRTRFTVMRLLERWGVLEHYVDEVLNDVY